MASSPNQEFYSEQMGELIAIAKSCRYNKDQLDKFSADYRKLILLSKKPNEIKQKMINSYMRASEKQIQVIQLNDENCNENSEKIINYQKNFDLKLKYQKRKNEYK